MDKRDDTPDRIAAALGLLLLVEIALYFLCARIMPAPNSVSRFEVALANALGLMFLAAPVCFAIAGRGASKEAWSILMKIAVVLALAGPPAGFFGVGWLCAEPPAIRGMPPASP